MMVRRTKEQIRLDRMQQDEHPLRAHPAIAGAVLALAVSTACADSRDDETTLTNLYTEVASSVANDKLNLQGVHTEEAPDPFSSPIAMGLLRSANQCVLILNVRSNPAFHMVIDLSGASTEVKERTIIAHEMGHCEHQSKPWPIPFVIDSHSSELYGDLFALAWTAKYHPADFEGAYKFLHHVRTRFTRGDDDPHPRASELARAKDLVSVVGDQESAAEVAMRALQTMLMRAKCPN